MVAKKLLHKGNLISLYKEQVDLPNNQHTYFDIVKHPGGSVIAAINDKDEICMLRQWRHAIQQTIWELPAGCLEPGEPAVQTAARELQEEAGVIAATWRDLGHITTTPGFSNEILYLFEARDLRAGTMSLDDAEQIEVHWIAISEVKNMANKGEIVDAKSLALLYRLLL